MSAKYDVYSLGIIIIELVTGSRNIPDSNNVSVFYIVDGPFLQI
jgi:serine/threonine protein kinase